MRWPKSSLVHTPRRDLRTARCALIRVGSGYQARCDEGEFSMSAHVPTVGVIQKTTRPVSGEVRESGRPPHRSTRRALWLVGTFG